MRNPDAPFLELGFYFRERSGRQALESLAFALMNQYQAIPRNAYVVDSDSPSLFRADEAIEYLVAAHSEVELGQLFRTPSMFVKKIMLEKGTGIVRDAREFVAALPIKNSKCVKEGNPVAIWVEGAEFGGLPWNKSSKEVASKALAVFRNLISHLRPTYASITVEYGLESPCELRCDSRSLAFVDFYVSCSDFGKDFLEELRIKFPDSAHGFYGDGQITLTSDTMRSTAGLEPGNGDHRYELSVFVAKSIAKLIA